MTPLFCYGSMFFFMVSRGWLNFAKRDDAFLTGAKTLLDSY